MTDELTAWLRAQLDEDERVAREAGYRSLTWAENGTWHLEGVEHNVVGAEEAFCHPHNVEHITRHDPARVLTEVDAKRRILDWCEAALIEFDKAGLSDRPSSPLMFVQWLALPYADRAGYRPEWRPE